MAMGAFGILTEADEGFRVFVGCDGAFRWGISEMLGLRAAEMPRSFKWAISGSKPLSFEIM